MSDDAVDKFFDEMVSPASTPTELDWLQCIRQSDEGRMT